MRSAYVIKSAVADRVHALADALGAGASDVSCMTCYDAIESAILDEVNDTYGDPMDAYADFREAAIGRLGLSGERIA